jgi:hypothetical protein
MRKTVVQASPSIKQHSSACLASMRPWVQTQVLLYKIIYWMINKLEMNKSNFWTTSNFKNLYDHYNVVLWVLIF